MLSLHICEECGATLVPFAEEMSMGMKCPNCSWAVVATNPDAMVLKGYPIPCASCDDWMHGVISDGSITYTCPSCGDSFLTSYHPAIFSDSNRYTVILMKLDHATKSHVRVISKLLKLNTIEAWKALKIKRDYEFEFDAIQAVGVVNLLEEAGIPYTITPELNFTTADVVNINEQEFL